MKLGGIGAAICFGTLSSTTSQSSSLSSSRPPSKGRDFTVRNGGKVILLYFPDALGETKRVLPWTKLARGEARKEM